jgi:hypothetical protein
MKTSVVRAWGLFASVVVAGVAAAQSGQAVEWKVSEGGNGHWYGIDDQFTPNWKQARTRATQLNGHLVSLTSSAEQSFVRQFVTTRGLGSFDVWLGAYRDEVAGAGPTQNWHWVTGESWSFTAWRWDGQPRDVSGAIYLAATSVPADQLGWVNSFENHEPGNVRGVIEWDSDCNADGIVDYGQILRGELEDLNSNGVPDICETSISSVLPPSVPSQGGSIITIRGNGFPANPTVLIGGVPATNVVRESPTRITATSPAVLPGMASVSVNDFILADGIYIRPDCGSDLDQNGVVDGGDMSILLLDWGQCYATVASLQAGNSIPFMLQEEPAVAAPQSR